MAGISVSKFQNHRKVFVSTLTALLVCCLGTNSFAQDANDSADPAAGIFPLGDAAIALTGAATLTTSADEVVVTLHASYLDPDALYPIWPLASIIQKTARPETIRAPRPKAAQLTCPLRPIGRDLHLDLGKRDRRWGGCGQPHGYDSSGPMPHSTFMLWGASGMNDNGVMTGLKTGNGLMVERHIIFFTHGEVIPAMSVEQISAFSDGCPPNDCVNQPAASFPVRVLSAGIKRHLGSPET